MFPKALWYTLALAVSLWLGIVSPAHADRPADTQQANIQHAERTKTVPLLTQELHAHDINVAMFLEKHIGYPPPDARIDRLAFLSIPDALKLELALTQAGERSPRTERATLALMSRALAAESRRSISELPEILQVYADVKTNLQDLIEIARIRGSFHSLEPINDLSEGVHEELRSYAQRFRLPSGGGAYNAIRQDFNLDGTRVAQLLSQAPTFEIAVQHAFQEQQVKVGGLRDRLVQRARSSPATRPTSAVELIIREQVPPSAETERVRLWEDLLQRLGSDRGYDSLRRSDRGIGGIMAGAPTLSGPGTPRPTALGFKPAETTPGIGQVWFRFDDGKTRTLPNVPTADARIAFQMLYGKSPVKLGDGIPLTDITSKVPYFEVGDRSLVKGSRAQVVLHPTLNDTELGWCCIRIDCLPESRRWLLDQLAADPALGKGEESQEQLRLMRQAVELVFDPWGRLRRSDVAANRAIFRITDVPTVCTVDDKTMTLIVERDPPKGERWPVALRRQSFLEVQLLYREKDSKMKEPRSFEGIGRESSELIPEVARISPEVRRLNNFSKLLAAMRWAAGNGAITRPEEKDWPAVAGHLPTPCFVAMTPEKIIPIPPFKSYAGTRSWRPQMPHGKAGGTEED